MVIELFYHTIEATFCNSSNVVSLISWHVRSRLQDRVQWRNSRDQWRHQTIFVHAASMRILCTKFNMLLDIQTELPQRIKTSVNVWSATKTSFVYMKKSSWNANAFTQVENLLQYFPPVVKTEGELYAFCNAIPPLIISIASYSIRILAFQVDAE